MKNTLPGQSMSANLARKHERERIAHELHDNVNQILTSAYLHISALDKDSPEFEAIRAKAVEIILLGIDEIRKVCRELSRQDLNGGGLVPAIHGLIKEIGVCKSFQVEFVHNDIYLIENLPTDKKTTLFRILQEQIKNIIYYSQASNIHINLHCNDQQCRMQISDDGIGFDPVTTPKGLGLSNILSRTRFYNGKAILESAAGKGCTLIINLPSETATRD